MISDCRAAVLASSWSPAPMNRATTAVVPTLRAMKAAMAKKIGWLVKPIAAIAAGPTPPTIIMSTMLNNWINSCSTTAGQAKWRTSLRASSIVNSCRCSRPTACCDVAIKPTPQSFVKPIFLYALNIASSRCNVKSANFAL